MADKIPNLEWNIDINDLSSLPLDDIDSVLNWGNVENVTNTVNNTGASPEQVTSSIDESVFLESWDSIKTRKNVLTDWDDFWKYLRLFFFSLFLILLWLAAIALFYSFNIYITEASKSKIDEKYASYIEKYKWMYSNVKSYIWINNQYESPKMWTENEWQQVNNIINATDIDYIEKKDLLSSYASNLVREAEAWVDTIERLKQDIWKQWFLPDEIWNLLSEDQAIDTIQRSLNAIEVVKFSTATKVFVYMNSALSMIAEMMRISWANVDSIRELFSRLSSRWDKDISAYVYMCYLNPFEWTANCDTIWDLDLYYNNVAKDKSINVRLFKNAMNAISQILEKEDTSLFSITFNGFNASDKSLHFNIEVSTTKEDEKVLKEQWIDSPNVFILRKIVNWLKLSLYIIWREIDSSHVDVVLKTIMQGGYAKMVHYSSLDFSVPIQKNAEREIFDYIDSENMEKLLSDRWFRYDVWMSNDSENTDNQDVDEEENTENLSDENEEEQWESDNTKENTSKTKKSSSSTKENTSTTKENSSDAKENTSKTKKSSSSTKENTSTTKENNSDTEENDSDTNLK